MAVDKEWGRRLRAARRAYDEKHDTRLTFTEVGKRVALLMGRATPFRHPTVRSWFMDGQEPESIAVAKALAQVLEADARDLIVGDVIPLRQPVKEDTRVSDEEVAEVVERVAAKKKGKKTKRA